MEYGTVTFFDGRDNKRYGFLKADADGKQIFFHANNEVCAKPSDDGADPVWSDRSPIRTTPPIFPRKGCRILFEREDAPKGPKATRWSYDIYCHYYPGNDDIIRMAVEWDIIVITFAKKQFPADSLFGTMEDRVGALFDLGGFGGTFDTSFRYDPEVRFENWTAEKRTFRFELGSNFNHLRFCELSLGRGIVENITLDELDRVRHARRWCLPATASLDEIVDAYRGYIVDLIS